MSIIGAASPEFRTDGEVDLFDCAGQGRIDAFFLSGGQIDGGANINLVGVGPYPRQTARWWWNATGTLFRRKHGKHAAWRRVMCWNLFIL